MGLDLVCGRKSVGMSYSSMQRRRRDWMEAYIKWSKVQPEYLPAQLVQECIQEDGIDYDLFSTLRIDCGIFDGLQRFIDHSDCDGHWSEYDSAFILTTLLALTPFLWEMSPQDFEDGRYLLHDLLQYSVRSRRDIQFQ